MDINNPPEIIIQHIEKHDIREEEIERVARLLSRQAGEDPDHDDKCSENSCLLIGGPPYWHWHKYRDPAEKLLAQIFGPEISCGAIYSLSPFKPKC